MRTLWVLASAGIGVTTGFTTQIQPKRTRSVSLLSASTRRVDYPSPEDDEISVLSRRSFMIQAGFVAGVASLLLGSGAAGADDETFESIAARASKMSKQIEAKEEQEVISRAPKAAPVSDTRTVYDFSLPIAGQQVPFKDLVKQEFPPDDSDADPTVKVILVVNIKQDDPYARKNIPEFISLASKFGRSGAFHIVACPTDQGYYEPDTSSLIRLKLQSEYGYGINPATHVTDKVNLLGTGAVPFWRWLEGTCRTPAGIGSVQGNFEKFLIDGRTGKPVRRYPRKYRPFDMQDDIEALLAGKKLPPAGSNFLEEWRMAADDAGRDTYRFQKGLNVFDQ